MASQPSTSIRPRINPAALEAWPVPKGVAPALWASMSLEERENLIIDRSFDVTEAASGGEGRSPATWTLKRDSDDPETVRRVERLAQTEQDADVLAGWIVGAAVGDQIAGEPEPTSGSAMRARVRYIEWVKVFAAVVAVILAIVLLYLLYDDIFGNGDDGASGPGGQVTEEVRGVEPGDRQEPAPNEEAGESDAISDAGAAPVTSLPQHPSEMHGTWEQTTLVGDQDELWTIELGEDDGVGTMIQSQEGMDDLLRYWRMGGEEGEPLMLVSNSLEKYENLQHDWAAAVEVIGDTMTWAIGSEGDNVLTFERS